MSIVQRVPGTKFMVLNGMSSQLKTNTFDSGDVLAAGVTVTTLVSECVGAVTVFGDLDNVSDDTDKSDFSSFITLQLPSTIVTFELLDDNCNVVAILNDPTYGKYFPQGFAPGSDFFQQQYVGFRVQWRKVLDILGPGGYKVRTRTMPVLPPFISISEIDSCCFELCQYTDERANETVRIETKQNGNIIGEGLNYLGINWREQIRLPGFFGNKQRRLEQDNYLDKNRRTTQIQDSLIHEFTLEPYFWTACLREKIDSILLANNILISDYNLLNTDDLKKISVIPTSIDTEYFGKSKKAADEIKFEERQKNRVKRNVK